MKYSMILVASLLFLQACKTAKHSTNVEDKKSVNTNVTEVKAGNSNTPADATTLTADVYRLIVSFFSFGAGTDFKNIEEFKKYVESFNEMHKRKAVVEMYPWGREGEVDYCFKLADFSPQEVEGFILGAGKILSKSDRVHVSRDSKCTHKR